MNRRNALNVLGASAGSVLLPVSAIGAGKPVVPTLKIMLGTTAGSALDAVCRRIGEGLKPGYASTVIVDNKTGASGQLAIIALKTAPADGSVALLTPSNTVTVHPLTYKKLGYDPDADLVPVSLAATVDVALAVGPLVPSSVTTLKGFFEWCRSNQGEASFGSPQAGSTMHFIGVMAARKAGAKLEHVAYRGPGPAINDMVGGQISAAMSAVGDLTQFAAAGRCRILATTGFARSRLAPKVPTFAELGYGDLSHSGWHGLFLPAGTPAAIVNEFSAELKRVLADKSVVAYVQERGMDPTWSTPEEMVVRIRRDRARWAPVVKELNFTMES